MGNILFKNIGIKVDDVSEEHRTVKIIVSAFGNKDSDGDIIRKGAFAKTLSERGPQAERTRIKHLLNHNWTQLIGAPVTMTEADAGLVVESKIANHDLGRNAIENYKLDLYEHSIGFEVPEGKQEFSEEDDANIIKEIKLWEYSSVPWGANPNTPTLGLKDILEDPNGLEHLSDRMERLQTAVRKGNFTDEAFDMIEYELSVLKAAYGFYITSLHTANVKLMKAKKEPDKDEIFAKSIQEFIDEKL